ncbi:hypothetical protein [Paraburkholderia saeva]|uniref:Uncharacterized protein n=1 Tax=Paraburkholderia saeva TaxID=2777537 RepID=A0A9N8X556_9BURK|nr:hypothetical protein [Paraburkholderia saeva]CAG4919214.1 hypothetical protein LMG31841_04855 [Paraburkholderia saeva]
MNRIDAVKPVSFPAAGVEAARRWLLCPSASMADYRDSVLADLLNACDKAQHVAEHTREFRDGFAARIAQEIAIRSTDVHCRARKVPQSSSRSTRLCSPHSAAGCGKVPNTSIHQGDRVRSIWLRRMGTAVKIYSDGSAAVCWDDGDPQPEGLAHGRMPRRLLELIEPLAPARQAQLAAVS